MNICESLERTSEQLKIDLDSTFPIWWQLKVIFNCFHYFQHVKLARSSSRKGFHIFIDVPSSLDLRRALGDDRGRIWCTELRSLMLGAKENHDIIYKAKGRFKFIKVKGKWIHIWLKEPMGDEAISVEDLLRLPSKLAPPQHMRRRIRYERRKGWKHRKPYKLLSK